MTVFTSTSVVGLIYLLK